MSRVVITEAIAREHAKDGVLVVPDKAVVTPLAADWLREQAIRLERDQAACGPPGKRGAATLLVVGGESTRRWTLVEAALRRDGLDPQPLQGGEFIESLDGLLGRLAARPDTIGVVLTDRPAVVVCYANKHTGVRAVAPPTVRCAETDVGHCHANLLVVAPENRSFWEIKRMVQALAGCPRAPWGDEVNELRLRLMRPCRKE